MILEIPKSGDQKGSWKGGSFQQLLKGGDMPPWFLFDLLVKRLPIDQEVIWRFFHVIAIVIVIVITVIMAWLNGYPPFVPNQWPR